MCSITSVSCVLSAGNSVLSALFLGIFFFLSHALVFDHTCGGSNSLFFFFFPLLFLVSVISHELFLFFFFFFAVVLIVVAHVLLLLCEVKGDARGLGP